MISVYVSELPQVPVKEKYRTEHQKGLELLSYGLKELYQLDISAKQLPDQIEKGTYGKTYLREHPQIHFNISHCDGMAVCAFAEVEIGADAEKKDEVNEKIFRRVFTQSEQELLKSRKENEEEYRESFYRLWTLKESRIKQNGSGMSMSLTDFSFEFTSGDKPEQGEFPDTVKFVFKDSRACLKNLTESTFEIYAGENVESIRENTSGQEWTQEHSENKYECTALSEVQSTEPELQFLQYRIAEEWILALCVEKRYKVTLVRIEYL